MTQKNLEKELLKLAKAVTKDDRWDNNDSFHATIFGIILFGYGLGFGRNILFLDLKEIQEAIFKVLTRDIGWAKKWTKGLIEDVLHSLEDESYNQGYNELISVGYLYFGSDQLPEKVDNVFTNIDHYRDSTEEE